MLPTLAPSTSTSHQNTSRQAPVALSSRRPAAEAARVFLGTQPFERFGRWARPISVARDGTLGRLARWLALHRHEGDDDAVWYRCHEANPECFRTYRVVALDRPSLFLPAGEVVFDVAENPTQIPDRPPQGVMLRHMEAMDAFAHATFYFLRPVFVTEPRIRLCTADELRREAYFDEYDARQWARHFGWAYRSQEWLVAKRDRAALIALRTLGRAVEALTWELMPTLPGGGIDPAKRRLLRQQLQQRMEHTESLGLVSETRRLKFALEELRRRITIDPVLAFEVTGQPGELWFEAHWFAGNDGRTYVHY